MNLSKFLSTVFICFVATFAFGQTATTPNALQQTQQFNIEQSTRAYLLAQRFGDYENAIAALYDVLAVYPSNDSLLYSLSYLYFQNGKFPQAVLVAKDLLAANPNHAGGLEITGAGYEQLGVKDKSLDAYETLYLKTSDYQTLYKIAFLQYDLQRYAECGTNINILMQNPQSDSLSVFFAGENNEQVEYPIKVALHNLTGLVYKAKGDVPEAKKAFEAALALAPNFTLARQNLESLDSK